MQNILSKFGEYCGFDDFGGNSKSATKAVEDLVIEQTNNSQPLADLLQYDLYEKESGIFYNSDGTAGAMFEIATQVGGNLDLEKNLKRFFNDELPEKGCIQFLIISSNDISRILDIWQGNNNVDLGSLASLQLYYRRKMWEERAKDFSSASEGVLPRYFRSFVCYSTKLTKKEGDKSLKKFVSKLNNKLKVEGFCPRVCSADDLIQVSREIIQMQSEPERRIKYDIYNKLSDQVPSLGAGLEVSEDSIHQIGSSMVSKIYGIKKHPEYFPFSGMLQLMGTEKRSIPGRFVISYIVSNCLGSVGTEKIKKQADRSMKASEQPHTRNNHALKEEAAEWRHIMKQHNAEGEVFVKESMQIMLTAPKEEIEIAEENLKSIWGSLDWELEELNAIQLIALLSILPMQQSSFWQQLEYFKQSRNVMSSEAIAKLPIQGEWQGVNKGGVLFEGRRGGLFNWNPFVRLGGDGNYNVVIIAPTGSGKSFLGQDVVWALLRDGVQIFVIDIGGSFKAQCQAVGGEMLGFDSKTEISLNPFAALKDGSGKFAKALDMLDRGYSKEEIAKELSLDAKHFDRIKRGSGTTSEEKEDAEDIEVIELTDAEGKNTVYVTKDSLVYAKSVISSMCGVIGNPEGQGLVERMITELLVEDSEEIDITMLMDHMKKEATKPNNPEGALLSKMANSLYPYSKKGVHGRFFKAGKTATFKEAMTVLEFETVANDEALMSVMLQIILMQVTNQFLTGDRSKQFALVVDEAWKILDYSGAFLERFARTVRKYGGSLIVIVQDPAVFDNSKGNRRAQAAVLENSSWSLIGKPKSGNTQAYKISKVFEDSLGLIESISKNKYWAEWAIFASGLSVVGRLSVDPLSTALYSTESKDFSRLKELEDQGFPVFEQVLQLAKEKNGIEAPDFGILSEGDKDLRFLKSKMDEGLTIVEAVKALLKLKYGLVK